MYTRCRAADALALLSTFVVFLHFPDTFLAAFDDPPEIYCLPSTPSPVPCSLPRVRPSCSTPATSLSFALFLLLVYLRRARCRNSEAVNFDLHPIAIARVHIYRLRPIRRR